MALFSRRTSPAGSLNPNPPPMSGMCLTYRRTRTSSLSVSGMYVAVYHPLSRLHDSGERPIIVPHEVFCLNVLARKARGHSSVSNSIAGGDILYPSCQAQSGEIATSPDSRNGSCSPCRPLTLLHHRITTIQKGLPINGRPFTFFNRLPCLYRAIPEG